MGIQTAPMSTVQDETETGLEADIEDASSEHESQSLEKSLENGDNAASLVPSNAEVLRDVAHGASFADKQAVNGTSYEGHLSYQQDEEDTSNGDLEPVLDTATEKPSSADGSLSTPDDPPSIQVRSEQYFSSVNKYLMFTGFTCIISRKQNPVASSRFKSNPISAPI